MKNYIYILLVSCVLSIISISCNDDSETIFKETASQRKTAAMEEYQQLLKSSEDGWVFQYYPEDNQKYGGYTYVVKFNDNDSVSVYFELAGDVAIPEKSFYEVISYGGPVLSFNTYNSFMHYFAEPSSSEYNAKGGDSEFLLMSDENDVISITGVKTGNNMRLIKLTESPEDYLAKVKSNADLLGLATLLPANVGGTEVAVNESNRNFTFSYVEDDETKSVSVPFIVTTSGVSFYEQIEVLGQVFNGFTLDKENYKLISDGGEVSIDMIIPPIDLSQALWKFDISDATSASVAVINAWTIAYNDNVTTWGEELSPTLYFGNVNGDQGISFLSYPGPYRSHFNLGFNGVLNQANYIDIVAISAGYNWKWYTHLSPVVDVIADNSPYVVVMDDADNPTQVKLTSVSNPNVWFILN